MKNWFYFSITLTLLVVDQLIKNLSIKNTLPEMGGYLVNLCNPNLALGIPINELFFWFIWILIIVLIIYFLKKSFNFFLLIVLFGAISNAFDRVMQGCVIDYINIPFFPAFNIADVMITAGIILFIFQDVFWKNKKTD